MINEIHWHMVATYIAVGLIIVIPFLNLTGEFAEEKEVRLFTILGWTIATLFFSMFWPLVIFLICLELILNFESKARQVVSKWFNKINIVLWRKK